MAELQKPSARSLLTTVWITEIPFASKLDSVTRPASPKSRMTASPTRVGNLAICPHIVFFSLPDDAECMGRILEAGHSSGACLSVTPSNVPSISSLRTLVASSFKAPSNDRGSSLVFRRALRHLIRRHPGGRRGVSIPVY